MCILPVKNEEKARLELFAKSQLPLGLLLVEREEDIEVTNGLLMDINPSK